ncbi:MAG: 50S ribosomal protein L31e [Candidatus Aenigmarchaeota archaeon]|nr:50S ribosomal protein L31e [Candidatus Aenigmarchaeota archaeon]
MEEKKNQKDKVQNTDKKVEKSKSKVKREKKEFQLPANAKVFTAPLRKAFKKTRKKRVPYAIKILKEFVRRHMKVKEGEVKIGTHLNEKMWERGIEKPPRRVRIYVVKVDNEYRAELLGFEYKEFKPIKVEEKGLTDKLMSRLGPKALKKQEEEKMIEGKKEKKIKDEKKVENEKNEEKGVENVKPSSN